MTQQSELGKVETSESQLRDEPVKSRTELGDALDQTTNKDTTILHLNQQMALLQHEVDFLQLLIVILAVFTILLQILQRFCVVYTFE